MTVSLVFRAFKFTLLCLCFVVLAGCRATLYTNLTEKECNEMLAVLLSANIHAQKEQAKGGLLRLVVDDALIAEAITVLNRHGLPRDEFSSINTMFPKDGLIASPLAERARFIFAISQELSQTISMIDGVIDARVHVVIPGLKSGRETVAKSHSTASVFIRYRSGIPLRQSIPQIKLLISTAVEGLAYQHVNVVLFEVRVDTPDVGASALANREGNSLDSPHLVFLSLLILILIGSLAAGSGFLWWKLKGQKPAVDESVLKT